MADSIEFTMWRLLIGPPYQPYSSPYHFDWRSIHAGVEQHQIPPLPTFLADDLDDGETTAVFSAGIDDIPEEGGGFWIGPNGAGQGWEYCQYKSAQTVYSRIYDLEREPASDRDHNGNHSAGAPLIFWWTVENVTSPLQIDAVMDDNWATETWSASATGLLLPRNAMRNHHLAVVQVKNAPLDTWRNERVGWLDSPGFTDDATRASDWSFRIVDSAHMAGLDQIKGVTAGDMNIAKHGSATGSTSLSDPSKERSSGDYLAADPDLAHGSAIDDDDGTLWIAEQYIGTANYQASNDELNWRTPDNDGSIDTIYEETHFVVSGVFLQAVQGSPTEGHRWIELTVVPLSDGSTSVQDCVLYTEDPNNNVIIDMGESDAEAGQKIIICEDEENFREDYPVSAVKTIIEINANTVPGKPNFWNDISLTGDTLGFRQLNSENPGGGVTVQHGVSWGVGYGTTNAPLGGSNDNEYYFVNKNLAASAITANKPPAPEAGEILRYVFGAVNGDDSQTTSLAYWEVSDIVAPGYAIGEYGLTDGSPNQGNIHKPYIIVNLPALPLSLAAALSDSSDVGDKIYINDGSGPNTGGLDASGVIQIANEQIQYSAREEDGVLVQERGHNGTTAAPHVEGDALLFVENGVASNAPPVKEISWSRSGGAIYPKNFNIYVSAHEDAAPPTGEFWEDEWTELVDVSNHSAATFSYTLSSTRRVHRAMIIFSDMTEDPARPRLNEFQVLVDEAKYNADEFLTSGETAGDAIEAILELAGIPSLAITNTTTGDPLTDIVTADDYGWTVAADMADYANLRIIVASDSKIYIVNDDYWGETSFLPVETMDREDFERVDVSMNSGGYISQMIVHWRTASGGQSGTVVYPADALSFGTLEEIGPLIYPAETAAQRACEKLFYMRRYPYSFILECAYDRHEIEAGDFISLSWDMEGEDTPLLRTLIVTAVAHTLNDHIWKTVITATQIDRRSE